MAPSVMARILRLLRGQVAMRWQMNIANDVAFNRSCRQKSCCLYSLPHSYAYCSRKDSNKFKKCHQNWAPRHQMHSTGQDVWIWWWDENQERHNLLGGNRHKLSLLHSSLCKGYRRSQGSAYLAWILAWNSSHSFLLFLHFPDNEGMVITYDMAHKLHPPISFVLKCPIVKMIPYCVLQQDWGLLCSGFDSSRELSEYTSQKACCMFQTLPHLKAGWKPKQFTKNLYEFARNWFRIKLVWEGVIRIWVHALGQCQS